MKPKQFISAKNHVNNPYNLIRFISPCLINIFHYYPADKPHYALEGGVGY